MWPRYRLVEAHEVRSWVAFGVVVASEGDLSVTHEHGRFKWAWERKGTRSHNGT